MKKVAAPKVVKMKVPAAPKMKMKKTGFAQRAGSR